MEVGFGTQAVTFLWAVAAGAGLCLLYDLFRILRLALRSKNPGIFLQDLLYSFLAAIVTYLLLLARCRGELRGFVLLGELLGFLICRLTVSAVLYSAASKLIFLMRRLKKWFKRRILRPLWRILRQIFGFFGKLAKKLWEGLKSLRKFGPKAKKGLKHTGELVYNQPVRRKVRFGRFFRVAAPEKGQRGDFPQKVRKGCST